VQIVHHPSYTQKKNLWDSDSFIPGRGSFSVGSRELFLPVRPPIPPPSPSPLPLPPPPPIPIPPLPKLPLSPLPLKRPPIFGSLLHRAVISVLISRFLGGGGVRLVFLCLPLRGFFSSSSRYFCIASSIVGAALLASSWHLDRYSMVLLSLLYIRE
jgi:hypothetical protein